MRPQSLFEACRGIHSPTSHVTALVHVTAAVGGRAIEGAPADLARTELDEELAGAIPARARIDPFYALPRSSEMIAAYLEDRPFHLPIGHHRLRVLSDLAPCARLDGEEVTGLRRLGVALATGRRAEALSPIDAAADPASPRRSCASARWA